MNQAIISRPALDVEALQPIGGMKLLLDVSGANKGAIAWAEEHAEAVRSLLASNGALLIRGLRVLGSSQFGQILSTLFGSELLEYTYRSTPRTALRGNVYTATEYPSGEVIPQHNENAYSRHWPNRIGFLCLLPAESGGETPIGDSRVIYERLPPSLRAKFEELGVMYVRNYSTIDLPWTEVFQTTDRAEVESYCRANELSFEWIGDNALRTRQVNPATAKHPLTGQTIWFNQAHLFHVSNLGSEIAQTLVDTLGIENVPRNAYYGDGSPIEAEVLTTIRDLYERTRIKFQWQRNDLLLLDNMLFTHGREPYRGARKVLTGMADPNK